MRCRWLATLLLVGLVGRPSVGCLLDEDLYGVAFSQGGSLPSGTSSGLLFKVKDGQELDGPSICKAVASRLACLIAEQGGNDAPGILSLDMLDSPTQADDDWLSAAHDRAVQTTTRGGLVLCLSHAEAAMSDHLLRLSLAHELADGAQTRLGGRGAIVAVHVQATPSEFENALVESLAAYQADGSARVLTPSAFLGRFSPSRRPQLALDASDIDQCRPQELNNGPAQNHRALALGGLAWYEALPASLLEGFRAFNPRATAQAWYEWCTALRLEDFLSFVWIFGVVLAAVAVAVALALGGLQPLVDFFAGLNSNGIPPQRGAPHQRVASIPKPVQPRSGGRARAVSVSRKAKRH